MKYSKLMTDQSSKLSTKLYYFFEKEIKTLKSCKPPLKRQVRQPHECKWDKFSAQNNE